MNKKQKKNLTRIIIAGILFIVLKIIDIENKYLALSLYAIPYFIVGYDILRKAIKGIINKEIFDENFLMVVATIGAIGLGEYEEGVAVMLFYQVGEWFQSYAVGKSRKNIAALMDIRPDKAYIEKDNEIIEVDPYEVNIGDIIVIKVGDKIPLDGIVIDGVTSLNTSALTGEAKPKNVKKDDEVISGCINMTSPIRVKVTKIFNESTASKVLDLIENATSNKSKSEDFISKFAHYYTPIVCYCALALAIIPPLFIKFVLNGGWAWNTWIFRAFTFLVISCPCALVISIPLTFFAGIGGASKAGILVKGSNYLEELAKTKYVAFDKTGTMTLGIFEVTTIHNNDFTKEQLLEYAAYAEAYTNHPIGKSIIKEYGKQINKSRIKSIREIPGQGVYAIVDNVEILAGNDKLMNDNNIKTIPCDDLGTIVHLAINKQYKGHIHIGDKIKPTSVKAVADLKNNGIKQTIMLTGDEKTIAEQVAKEIKLDKVYFELLPQDKVEIIQKLLDSKERNETLAFIGDGINDAPVIALADVGIAMGALGSDAAIEAADIVLMDDDPLKVSKAIKIAKKCMHIVYENIYFAIGIKVITLILGAFGYAEMWLAIFADVGVMIIAVINAIRALRVKKL